MREINLNEPNRFWYNATLPMMDNIRTAKLEWDNRLRDISKPTILPKSTSSTDIAIADILFWADIFAEHAGFMTLYLPSAELSKYRERFEESRYSFLLLFSTASLTGSEREHLESLSHMFSGNVEKLMHDQKELRDRQNKGEKRTLIYPELFDHMLEEEERGVKQVNMALNGEQMVLDELGKLVVDIMREHALHIRSMLNPPDESNYERCTEFAKRFALLSSEKDYGEDLDRSIGGMIDYKTTLLRDVASNRVRSAILPSKLDHYRREAIKFRSDLRMAR